MSTVTITIASLEVRHELTLERNVSQFSATVSLDVLGPTDYAAVVEAIQQRINGASLGPVGRGDRRPAPDRRMEAVPVTHDVTLQRDGPRTRWACQCGWATTWTLYSNHGHPNGYYPWK